MVCARLAIRTGQSMEWLLEAIHGDRRMFDSLWYEAFPPLADPYPGAGAPPPDEPAPPPEASGCYVDGILEGGR